MGKKFVFLLVLLLMLTTSTVVALAAGSGSDTPTSENSTKDKVRPDITTKGGIEFYTEKYSDVWFNDKSVSKNRNLVDYSVMRDYNTTDPLRHILSATVNDTGNLDILDPMIILAYIEVDGQYEPLTVIDTRSRVNNMFQGNMLLYAKIRLKYIGKDTVNNIRMIAFRKSDVDGLKLDKNMQITDLKINVRDYTVWERVHVEFNDLVKSAIPSASPTPTPVAGTKTGLPLTNTVR